MCSANLVEFCLLYDSARIIDSTRETQGGQVVGWKTYLVVIDDIVDEKVLLRAFNKEGRERVKQLTGAELFPASDFVVGTHNGCTIIGDPEIAMEMASEYEDSKVLSWVSSLGCSRVIACVLHSVVNLAAFSLFQDGRLVRAYACSADDGVFIDEGNRLECEKELYAKFRTETLDDGTLMYVDEHDEFDQSSLGEELVFDLLATVLGKRPDMDDKLFEIEVHSYSKPSKGLFSRLFGG